MLVIARAIMVALLLAVGFAPAHSQPQFNTTTGGIVNGIVPLCLNAANQAIPCTGEFQLSACSSGCNANLTVQNAAYAAGNAEGGLLTLNAAARFAGGTGILTGLRLRSKGGSTNTIWVYAWSKLPAATCTDKSAFAASDSDNAFALPGFPVSATLGGAPGAWDTSTYAQLLNLVANFKNQDATPGTAIYFCLVAAASVTPASTADLSLVVGGVQD